MRYSISAWDDVNSPELRGKVMTWGALELVRVGSPRLPPQGGSRCHSHLYAQLCVLEQL